MRVRAIKRSKAAGGLWFHISNLKVNQFDGFCVVVNNPSKFVRLIRFAFTAQKAFFPNEMTLSLVLTQNRGSLRMRK
ncbi:MAG: hypothetical protein ACTS7I_02140 [Candidatus Hodgkinia cicadicola]